MNKDKIENTTPGWEETVVMICSQCGSQSQRMKSDLKEIAKPELGKKVRVITTSCLNICPENKIAITVASNYAPEIFSFYEVDPTTTGEELYKKLLKK